MAAQSSETPRKNVMAGSNPGPRSSFVAVKGSDNTTHSSDDKPVDKCIKPVSAFEKPCLYCTDKGHSMDMCHQLRSKLFNDRIQFLRSNGLCFNCLKRGHQKSTCRCITSCQICQRRHPTVLHIENFKSVTSFEDSSAKMENSVNASTSPLKSYMGAGDDKCTFAILPVAVYLKNSSTVIHTYAFLDNGSNMSLCSDRLMNQLGASGNKMKIELDTMGVPHKMTTYAIKDLVIGDLDGNNSIPLGTVYTKPMIPANQSHIPRQTDIDNWPHMSGITLPQLDAGIDLLIEQ